MLKRKRTNTSNSVEVKAAKASRTTKYVLDNVTLPGINVGGEILVTGGGEVGQLGLGPDIMEKSRFTKLVTDFDIVDICGGGMHTVCLGSNGKLLTFGCNDEGALGRKTDNENNEDLECIPDEVELPGKVIQITAGDCHTAVLLDDGRVYAWGSFRDSHGSMGLTLNGIEKNPHEIICKAPVLKIASGSSHLVLLTEQGEVLTCGCPEQGQLGRTTERGSSRHARSAAGKSALETFLQPNPIHLKGNHRLHFDNIWATTYGTFCKVANKDDIYVFGLNNFYQLGLPTEKAHFLPTLSKDFTQYQWQSIVGGPHHTLGLTTDGKVYALGRKEYGRLGLGENCEDAKNLTEVSALNDQKVVGIGVGSNSSYAVTKEGNFYAWGQGSEGQLGTGEDDDCHLPTCIKSKQLVDRKVFRVGGGGQHAAVLIIKNNNNKRN